MKPEKGQRYTIREGSSEYPDYVQAECQGVGTFPGFHKFKTCEAVARTLHIHHESIFPAMVRTADGRWKVKA